MKILYNDGKYIALSSYSERHLLKEAGFFWDAEKKRWYTRDFRIATKLIEYCDSSAKAKILEASRSISLSSSVDADIHVPCPDGLSYMPFQKAGIAYALERQNTMIADEMGLGKTVQAIGLINADEKINKVVVICPAFLKLNWKHELQRWLVRDFEINIVYSNSFKVATYHATNTAKDTDLGKIFVVNYDILDRVLPGLLSTVEFFDLMIVDESHYAKNPKAKRTKAVAKLAAHSVKRVFLTGTPVTKNPIDLFPVLKMINHPLAKNWKYYALRYCDMREGKFGYIFGTSHQEELQQKLRETIMVCRQKKDVLSELPPKIRQIISISPDAVFSGLIAQEKALLAEYRKIYDNPSLLKDARMPALAKIANVRRQIAIAKMPIVAEHVRNILEQGHKVVIFSHHVDVAHAAYDLFADQAVLVTGEIPPEVRSKIVENFTLDRSIKVFVATLGSCGVGINLSAASVGVFVELDWIPATIQQAEDRLHRIGQKSSVLIQYAVVDSTLEATIALRLIDREREISSITDINALLSTEPDLHLTGV